MRSGLTEQFAEAAEMSYRTYMTVFLYVALPCIIGFSLALFTASRICTKCRRMRHKNSLELASGIQSPEQESSDGLSVINRGKKLTQFDIAEKVSGNWRYIDTAIPHKKGSHNSNASAQLTSIKPLQGSIERCAASSDGEPGLNRCSTLRGIFLDPDYSAVPSEKTYGSKKTYHINWPRGQQNKAVEPLCMKLGRESPTPTTAADNLSSILKSKPKPIYQEISENTITAPLTKTNQSDDKKGGNTVQFAFDQVMSPYTSLNGSTVESMETTSVNLPGGEETTNSSVLSSSPKASRNFETSPPAPVGKKDAQKAEIPVEHPVWTTPLSKSKLNASVEGSANTTVVPADRLQAEERLFRNNIPSCLAVSRVRAHQHSLNQPQDYRTHTSKPKFFPITEDNENLECDEEKPSEGKTAPVRHSYLGVVRASNRVTDPAETTNSRNREQQQTQARVTPAAYIKPTPHQFSPSEKQSAPGVFSMNEEEFIQRIDQHYEDTKGLNLNHFCELCEDGVFHMHPNPSE